jgi:hypothetical protein
MTYYLISSIGCVKSILASGIAVLSNLSLVTDCVCLSFDYEICSVYAKKRTLAVPDMRDPTLTCRFSCSVNWEPFKR